jgi:ribosome-associated toxin RatA of RatAB toxin-antitoxin module
MPMRVKIERGWGWGIVWLGLWLPLVSEADDAAPDWSRLFAGEVLAAAVQNRDGVPGVRAMFTVTASRERIWSVFVDYDHFPQFFPGIKDLKVLEQDEKSAKVAFYTPVAFMHYRYVLHRRYVEPGRRLTWTRLSGSFKSIDGSWEIRDTPRAGVSLVVYESFVNIGQLVPTTLVQRGALRRARDMGLRLRAWIEKRDLAGYEQQEERPYAADRQGSVD